MFNRIIGNIIVALLSVALLASSCKENRPQGKPLTPEELIDRNKDRLGREDLFIDSWLENKDWKIKTTSTGLRYFIYSDSIGDPMQTEDIAVVTYSVFLLDSSLVTTVRADLPKAFRIDRDDVISGLHEAAKLLSPGDSAILIVPSYLAYGLTGTTDIPSNMPLLYDIQVLDKR